MTKRRRNELTGTIKASWTRRATEYASGRGLDLSRLLQAADIAPSSLEGDGARIAFQKHVALLEAIATLLGDAGVGLDIGALGKPEDFGAMGLLAETSATLRDALDAIARFNPLANQASLASYWVEGERAFISDAHLPDGRPAPRLAAEATMTFYAHTIVQTTGVLHPFHEVHWAHGRHQHWTDERQRVFLGARFRFSMPKNALVVPSALLGAPLHSSRPALVPHLTTLAERLLLGIGDARNELEVIVACLRARLQRRESLSVRQTASALGCSTRTLHRRLGEAQVTFQQIVDEVLREQAEILLARDSVKLAEVAYQLGYADVRSLRRACQRWFGVPPVTLRRRKPDERTATTPAGKPTLG